MPYVVSWYVGGVLVDESQLEGVATLNKFNITQQRVSCSREGPLNCLISGSGGNFVNYVEQNANG